MSKEIVFYRDKSKDTESYPVIAHYVARSYCERCGALYSDGNVYASKYCDECKKIVKAEQTRERVRRFRSKKKGCQSD